MGGVVVHRAHDPIEAQVLASNLQAAGIPAYVEGGSLVDEWAMSQRLLNRLGVRVVVPEDRAEEAVEFLGSKPELSEAELAAQALAAAPDQAAPGDAPLLLDGMRRRPWRVGILLFLLAWPLAAIVVFELGAWLRR